MALPGVFGLCGGWGGGGNGGGEAIEKRGRCPGTLLALRASLETRTHSMTVHGTVSERARLEKPSAW